MEIEISLRSISIHYFCHFSWDRWFWMLSAGAGWGRLSHSTCLLPSKSSTMAKFCWWKIPLTWRAGSWLGVCLRVMQKDWILNFSRSFPFALFPGEDLLCKCNNLHLGGSFKCIFLIFYHISGRVLLQSTSFHLRCLVLHDSNKNMVANNLSIHLVVI